MAPLYKYVELSWIVGHPNFKPFVCEPYKISLLFCVKRFTNAVIQFRIRCLFIRLLVPTNLYFFLFMKQDFIEQKELVWVL